MKHSRQQNITNTDPKTISNCQLPAAYWTTGPIQTKSLIDLLFTIENAAIISTIENKRLNRKNTTKTYS